MSKLPSVFLLVACLATSSFAQTPNKPSRFHLDASDAAYWAGVGIGTGMTAADPKRFLYFAPSGPPGQFQIQSTSNYSVGRSLLIKSGVWGGIEALQFAKPNHRRLFFWSKIAAGATWAAVGIFRDKKPTGPPAVPCYFLAFGHYSPC